MSAADVREDVDITSYSANVKNLIMKIIILMIISVSRMRTLNIVTSKGEKAFGNKASFNVSKIPLSTSLIA